MDAQHVELDTSIYLANVALVRRNTPDAYAACARAKATRRRRWEAHYLSDLASIRATSNGETGRYTCRRGLFAAHSVAGNAHGVTTLKVGKKAKASGSVAVASCGTGVNDDGKAAYTDVDYDLLFERTMDSSVPVHDGDGWSFDWIASVVHDPGPLDEREVWAGVCA